MEGRLHCEVARSPAETFDFLADIRNERSWNPRLLSVEKTSPGPVAAGSTFTGRYKGIGSLTTELTDYERPRRIGFRSDGPRMGITGAFELTPTDRGTEIDLSADFRPRAFFRALAPLMSLVMKAQNEAAARRLQEVLDRAA